MFAQRVRALRLVRRQGGFTLIEMLIVISIIAVLAAMLMPALQKAQSTAVQIGCVNNFRQIHLATAGYINDNNGSFPLCLWYTGDRGIGYVMTTLGYVPVGQQNLFFCGGMSDLTCYDTNPVYKLSYAPNNFVFPGYSATTPPALVDRSPKTGDSIWRKVSGIRSPGKTMALKDQYITWRGYPQYRRWDQILEAHHWSAFDNSSVHDGSTNLNYVDGHSGPQLTSVWTTAEKQNLALWGILTW